MLAELGSRLHEADEPGKIDLTGHDYKSLMIRWLDEGDHTDWSPSSAAGNFEVKP